MLNPGIAYSAQSAKNSKIHKPNTSGDKFVIITPRTTLPGFKIFSCLRLRLSIAIRYDCILVLIS